MREQRKVEADLPGSVHTFFGKVSPRTPQTATGQSNLSQAPQLLQEEVGKWGAVGDTRG